VKRRFAILLSLSLLPLPLLSATSAQAALPEGRDLNALLERMEQHRKANGKLAEQYTSVMFWHNRNFNKSGKTTVDESAKYENVFVEGLPYSRKVEKNGKPLTGKDADWEQKRYDKAVEERKKMSLNEKRHSLHVTFHFSLPISYLTTLFDNRALRRETIDGRETLVVESTPRADAKPQDKEAKTALDWKQTTWIDLQDEMPVRFIAEKLNDENRELKGTTMQLDFLRLDDKSAEGGKPEQPVWLEKEFKSKFRMKIIFINADGITEQSWSDFKKFHVDVRLLLDTVEEVEEQKPAADQPRKP
jgi:outer membrane lipoprotein-sorting protein